MNAIIHKRFFYSLCFLFLFVGCQRDSLKVYPTTGKIVYQNKPVEGATVVFSTMDSEKDGRSAFGETDSNGVYVLSTSGARRKGAMTGDYEVRVIKTIPVDKFGKPINNKLVGGESHSIKDKKMVGGRPKIKSVIPEKYNNPNEALLHATVEKGTNTIDFELTD